MHTYTHTAGADWLDIFKIEQWKISLFAILNQKNIPITYCKVRICCTFFSEPSLPTRVAHTASYHAASLRIDSNTHLE